MSDLEACKSKEELHLYECLKEENRCTVANMKSDDICRKENLEGTAQCEDKKERLQFTNDRLELAQLHLSLGISNSYAIQRIHSMRFDKDFSGLEVQRNLHVSVDSSLKSALENAGIEDMNCTLTRELPLFVHSSADRMNILRRVPIFTEYRSDGSMMIKAKSREKVMPITLKNSPYERLLASQGFLLSCRYQNMPLSEITAKDLLSSGEIGDSLNAMSKQVPLTFEEEELLFRISPVKIGKDLLFYPSMQDKAIGFNRQAHCD